MRVYHPSLSVTANPLRSTLMYVKTSSYAPLECVEDDVRTSSDRVHSRRTTAQLTTEQDAVNVANVFPSLWTSQHTYRKSYIHMKSRGGMVKPNSTALDQKDKAMAIQERHTSKSNLPKWTTIELRRSWA